MTSRIVVLLSGSGSNLQALIDACAEEDYGVDIVAVGADRDGIGGLDRAHKANIPTFVHRVRDFADREAWDQAMAEAVSAYRPDLVVSAGFLKLLGKRFLEAFPGRYVNTHNSLLPAFPGMNGPAEALAAGVKVAGATLFICDAGVDTGPIIAQTTVPVLDGDTVDDLTERIKVAERRQLVQAVGDMLRHGWDVEGKRVTIRSGS
ncbi:phosphoribosylglycinamide formyltransferase [Natronoglycomyces albus]|uniref:Phosphoribosylglycinamide formyltransferase n=1 Tax=Natronoglycomyces albus TaxID=2811108 RepID=A0A895XNZ0_9ACTN|nr:phosphoribosylglycinamide formyltransferase [Natronoglycomyces albus]QSB04785.1 phosphoribosylglycinamide formyltransferase [Natronoglycomyces albus]